MSAPKTLVAIAIVALLHAALTCGLCVLCDKLAIGPYRWRSEPTLADSVSDVVLRVLIFPNFQINRAVDLRNQEAQRFVAMGCSLLWGMVLVGIFSIVAQLFGHSKHDADPLEQTM